MPKKTKEQFSHDVSQIYGELYSCDKVEYVNNKTKVTLTCKLHGDFSSRPNDILSGHGCQKCGEEKIKMKNKNRTKTQDKFIEEAKLIHGDIYDYSKTIYKNSRSKVTISCLEHGDFEINADTHITRKSGCPKCGNMLKGQYIKNTKEEFIETAKSIHGDKFDYSKAEYINYTTKIMIICKYHGEFEQTPVNHLHFDCQKCAIEKTHNLQRKTTSQFIRESQEIHGDKFDYTEVEYTGAHNKVIIICPEHGEFEKISRYHLGGSGCPRCCIWKNENACIEIIQKLTGHHFTKIRPKFLNGLELDGYNADIQLAIEYNGEQHYKIIDHFHRNGIIDLLKQVENDKIKKELCEKNGVYLIIVPYYIENKEEFIQEQLDNYII